MVRYVKASSRDSFRRPEEIKDIRIRAVSAMLAVVFVLVVAKLFVLMIFQHNFYAALASGSHEISAELFPYRGSVYIQDSRTGEEFPLAINKDIFLMFADTREIVDEDMAEDVAEKLAEVLKYDDEKKFAVFNQLKKPDDPYEPVEQKLDQEIYEQIKSLDLPGIHFSPRSHRFYPEGSLAAQVVGFLGKDEQGNDIGSYGIEGYWQKELAGSGGFLEGIRSAQGSWIPLAGRIFEPAEDGVDLVLTVDRTLQFMACEKLKEKQEEYGAQSASLVIIEPKTGAILAMCSLPDFDPNEYGGVENPSAYNNTNIFTPYEPGSIFKPIIMAGALNEKVVAPNDYFYDSGSVDAGCAKLIYNADGKKYGDQTMVGVLENSLNTGMVHVAQKLGKGRFINYVERFGFGTKTGISLSAENSGTIESLYRNERDRFDCYTATASFGQGITATPLQMVTAFSAIANGGKLMKPYIVKEVRHEDGKVETTRPQEIRTVIDKHASSLLAGMLVRSVDNGAAILGRVPGYYVAGKTGTAQIAGPGGYTDETNHSFIGFGPVDDPKFVMIVKFEKPRRAFASTTAAPTFAEIAKFIMQYYQIPPAR